MDCRVVGWVEENTYMQPKPVRSGGMATEGDVRTQVGPGFHLFCPIQLINEKWKKEEEKLVS